MDKDKEDGVFLQLSRDEAMAVAAVLGKVCSDLSGARWRTLHIYNEIIEQLGTKPPPCQALSVDKNTEPTLKVVDLKAP